MMKNSGYIFLFFLMLLVSCTDVVEVDLPATEPRLVVEASINWELDSDGKNQSIRLSKSTPYFSENPFQPVDNAQVKVTNIQTLEEFIFNHIENGNYINNNFIPLVNNEYQLIVEYDQSTYVATEKMIVGTPILNITQSSEEGFDKEAIEVKVAFQDVGNQENYYMLKFKKQGDSYFEYRIINDEFFNGNIIDIFYERREDEDTGEKPFEVGDVAEIELYGISKSYYNYISLLVEQSESSGNPFAAIPAELKGNVVDANENNQHAFGYFRLTQVDKKTYTIQ